MGARPSGYKKSGGFLNQVDGKISGYTFTDELPNGDAFKAGRDPKTKKEKFHSLFFRLSARVDGADEDVTTSLFAGSADDFTVSEDGQEIWDASYETPEEAVEAGAAAKQLGANTALATFISSLVEAGFPETNLSEDRLQFESIVGTRVRFVQRKDEETTKRLGKRKDPKTGKEYDRQNLVIDQVYALPTTEAAPAPAATKATKAPAKATKPAKAAKAAEAADVSELASETLLGILSASKDNSILKTKVGMKVLTSMMKHPQREGVGPWLANDEDRQSVEEVTLGDV